VNKKNVTLFIPCLVDSIYPEVGEAVVQVLKRIGVSMDYPENQTCCGLPPFNSGYRKEARVAAERFIEIFEDAGIIVCPSGSCVKMVKQHYLELFKEDSVWLERAQNVGQKTFEFTQYLVDVLGVEDVGSSYQGKVTYHDTCSSLRGLGVKEQPRKLIRMVDGVDYVEMNNPDRCCGFGGTFSFKYSDISKAMLEEKVNNIINCGAELVVGCDVSCLMNIQGMLNRKELPIKTLHIAQFLAKYL
jgi:L-lactate dehydrogenase complex protein LldE